MKFTITSALQNALDRPTDRGRDGHAQDHKPIDAQAIGQCLDIAGPIEQAPSGLEIGDPVPWAVRRDHAYCIAQGSGFDKLTLQAGRGEAVKVEQR